MSDESTSSTTTAPDEAPVDTAECGWPATSKYGSHGKKVEALQTALFDRGWYHGPIDGDYGDLTQQGVQKVQQGLRRLNLRHGPIDGQFDDDTRKYACMAYPF